MRVSEVNTGDWFERNGERFIKVNPFLRGKATYHAVSLVDGQPAFLVRTSTGDHPSIGTEEVTLVDKPAWARPQERVRNPV